MFDHLTVVDAGFAVQLRQGIAVLGIAIGCNDNQGRWFWQRESFEHLVEELGAGCFGSFSADIENDESRIALESKVGPPIATVLVFQIVTVLVFFGQRSRVRPVPPDPGGGSDESVRSKLRHARRSIGNTG